MKRYAILIACMAMLLFLGTNQAWSVFVRPLRSTYGFSAMQMQLIFNTGTLSFCTVIVLAGRLHDRFGPRPLAALSGLLIGLAWTLAWAFGERYLWLWFSVGVLASSGSAVGYTCPIATAVKWFPRRPGLISGLTAAGFGGGPILLSAIAERLMGGAWRPTEVFGFVAVVYAPTVFAAGMLLARPAGLPGHAEVVGFRRRGLLRDRRFWTLCAGMFAGTLPFLVVMGNAKPLALDFGYAERLAATAIGVLAVGNAAGRIVWGMTLDRIGTRRAMLAAQAVMLVSLTGLVAMGRVRPAFFFVSLFGIGFCYGSNFAIYPATVARLYGIHLLGSIYPFIMAAQGLSSFATTLNGFLKDATGSNLPGLVFALAVAVLGMAVCAVLSRSLSQKPPTEPEPAHAAPPDG